MKLNLTTNQKEEKKKKVKRKEYKRRGKIEIGIREEIRIQKSQSDIS